MPEENKSPLNAGNRAVLNLNPKEPGDTTVPSNVTAPVATGTVPEGAVAPETGVVAPAVETSVSGPVVVDPVMTDITLDLGESVIEEPTSEPEPDAAHMDAIQESITDEQRREAFIKMRRQLHEKRTADTVPAPADESGRVQELETQLAETTEKLGKLSLQEDPKFQRKYDEPYSLKIKSLAPYAEAVGVSMEVVQAASNMSIVDRNEYVNENFGTMSGAVMSILADADTINMQRSADLEHWREERETLNAQESQRSSVVQQEMARETFEGAVSQLQQDDFLPFTHIDGNEGWNANVDKIQAEAWALFQRDDLPAQAKAMAQGVAAPHLLRSFLAARTELAEANAQLAKLGHVTPALNPSSAQTATPTQTPTGPATSKEAAARATARMRDRFVNPS